MGIVWTICWIFVWVAADNYTQMEGQDKTLYFRRKNKTCYALQLRRQPVFRSLVLLLAKREAIPAERLLLFSRGQRLTQTFDFTGAAEKQIIHIVDEVDTQRESVTFYLRFPGRPLTTHTLPSSTLVRDFIVRELSSMTELVYFQLGLVYLGKIMHPRKTFRQEYLENQAEIIVVNVKQFLKGKQIDKVADIVGAVNTPIDTPTDAKGVGQQERIQEIVKDGEKVEGQSPVVEGVKQIEERPSGSEGTISEESSAKEESSIAEEQVFIADNELPVPVSKDHSIIAAFPTINIPPPIQPTLTHTDSTAPIDQFPPSSLITEPPQSQLDLINFPQNQFRIKISSVESAGSDESNQNLVIFDPDEQIEPIDELKETNEFSQPLHSNLLPRQSLREFDLSPGDFMLPSPTHRSESCDFIEKVLKDYKFLFEST